MTPWWFYLHLNLTHSGNPLKLRVFFYELQLFSFHRTKEVATAVQGCRWYPENSVCYSPCDSPLVVHVFVCEAVRHPAHCTPKHKHGHARVPCLRRYKAQPCYNLRERVWGSPQVTAKPKHLNQCSVRHQRTGQFALLSLCEKAWAVRAAALVNRLMHQPEWHARTHLLSAPGGREGEEKRR